MKHMVIITDIHGRIVSIDHKEAVKKEKIVPYLDQLRLVDNWELLSPFSFLNIFTNTTMIQYTLIRRG